MNHDERADMAEDAEIPLGFKAPLTAATFTPEGNDELPENVVGVEEDDEDGIPIHIYLFMCAMDIASHTLKSDITPGLLRNRKVQYDKMIAENLNEQEIDFILFGLQVYAKHIDKRRQRIKAGLTGESTGKIILPNGREV